MSSVIKQQHHRPWLLVAAYLLAVVGSSVMLLVYNKILQYFPTMMAQWHAHVFGVINEIESFAFAGLAIWLAARDQPFRCVGTVTLGLLFLVSAATPALNWIVEARYPAVRNGFSMYMAGVWISCFRAIAYYWILFVLAFRGMGISLRRSDAANCSRTLSISVLMVLTLAVAAVISIEIGLARMVQGTQSFQIIISSLPSIVGATVLWQSIMVLLFTGVIMIFLAANPWRSMGWFAIGAWVLASTLMFFWFFYVIYPSLNREIAELNQQDLLIDSMSWSQIFGYLVTQAASVVFAFLTVYLFHFAGYRWERSTSRAGSRPVSQTAASFADVE